MYQARQNNMRRGIEARDGRPCSVSNTARRSDSENLRGSREPCASMEQLSVRKWIRSLLIPAVQQNSDLEDPVSLIKPSLRLPFPTQQNSLRASLCPTTGWPVSGSTSPAQLLLLLGACPGCPSWLCHQLVQYAPASLSVRWVLIAPDPWD